MRELVATENPRGPQPGHAGQEGVVSAAHAAQHRSLCFGISFCRDLGLGSVVAKIIRVANAESEMGEAERYRQGERNMLEVNFC